MKMKRYVAADMRQAIRKVREDQGADAVILSNRRVDGGVEIVTAIDYEPDLVEAEFSKPPTDNSPTDNPSTKVATAVNASPVVSLATPTTKPTPPVAVELEAPLADIQLELKGLRSVLEAPMLQFGWGEMRKIHPQRSQLLKQLMGLGLSPALCQNLVEQIALDGNMQQGWQAALKMLTNLLPISDDDILSDGGIVTLLGPTGVGKTTTIAKLAARFALRHGRRHLALVTTDSYRIGAHEQLRTYGRMLGVPVHTAADKDELQTILNHNHDKKLILIDSAGFSQRDVKLAEQLATFNLPEHQIKNYLVLSATSQAECFSEILQSFHKVKLRACILSKTDEAVSIGAAISTFIEQKIPVAFISNGQQVPDDLHPANAQKLLAKGVKLMDQRTHSPAEEVLAFNFGGMVANAYV